MADHAIGSRISLVSKAEIRYEGFLHFINPEENTVGLKDVRMLGTQGRRGGQGEVEANNTTYDFIIFRGGDIKDLTVFDDNQQQEEQRNDHAINDPAIMSSKAAPSSFADRNVRDQQGRDRREDRRSDFGTARQTGGGFYDNNRRDDRFDNRRGGYDRRDNYNNYGGGGYGGGYGRGGRIGGYEGGRGGRGNGGYNNHGYDRHRGDFDAPRPEYHTGRDFDVAPSDKKEKLEPFDFAKANAEFEKQKAEFDKAREEVLKANAGRTYDKSSFFDNISSEATDRKLGGFNLRPDRDEQRRADVQTFGQEAVGNMRGFRRGRGGRGRFGRN